MNYHKPLSQNIATESIVGCGGFPPFETRASAAAGGREMVAAAAAAPEPKVGELCFALRVHGHSVCRQRRRLPLFNGVANPIYDGDCYGGSRYCLPSVF